MQDERLNTYDQLGTLKMMDYSEALNTESPKTKRRQNPNETEFGFQL